MRLRAQAKRLGLRLAKDRARRVAVGHLGQWQVTEAPAGGQVVAGSAFELTLSDIEELLDAREADLARAMQAAVD